MNINEKLVLLTKCIDFSLKQEYRGNTLCEYKPKVNLNFVPVFRQNDFDEEPFLEFETNIVLQYPTPPQQEIVVENWGTGGVFETLDKSVDGNLLCMYYNLKDMQRELTQLLDVLGPEVEKHFPSTTKS